MRFFNKNYRVENGTSAFLDWHSIANASRDSRRARQRIDWPLSRIDTGIAPFYVLSLKCSRRFITATYPERYSPPPRPDTAP